MSVLAIAGRRRLIFAAVLLLAFLYPSFIYWYEIQNTLSLASRPLWAVPVGPDQIIPHFFADTEWIPSDICALHGWDARSEDSKRGQEVWDSIILDGPTEAELDLLEIRLEELGEVVDKVFIVESNRTINGTPKGFYFNERLRWTDRMAPFESMIVYRAVYAPPIDSFRSPSPEAWSNRLRDEMNALLRTRSSNTLRPPVVLFSGVDEIPAAHTVRLLRDCAFTSPLHLQMRRFLYGFSWPVGWDSWRAQAHVWDIGTTLQLLGGGEAKIVRRRTGYSHEQVSQKALADAGWHCSYCYRDVEDVLAKMQDEIGLATTSLTLEGLQQSMCEGKDALKGIKPEYEQIYSYKNMINVMSSEATHSGIGVPKFTITAIDRFRHLFPGVCNRVRSKVEVIDPPSLDDEGTHELP